MMTVYAISDLHGNLPEIPQCDLLLLGGDYCKDDSYSDQCQFFDQDFRTWLQMVPARYIVGVAGNHDKPLADPYDIFEDLPWHYLEDSGIEIEGISIWGTPWVPKFGNWSFMKNDDSLAENFAKIPEGLDILLSHGPCFGILDRSNYGDYCGSRQLRERVKDVVPDTFVCGHIHEARGIADDGVTRYFNVSHCDGQMRPTGKPVYIPLRSG